VASSGATISPLMQRAFAIDVLESSHGGGRLRLIATLHDPAVIRALLAHLGIPVRAESRPRAARALIGCARARSTPSCLRGEVTSALIRPGHVPDDGGSVPA
jgi:hypothetical protein